MSLIRSFSRFGIENFRIFRNMTEFSLKPITILTGPNNSGKSSLLKALLLFEENKKSNNKLSYISFDKNNLLLHDFKSTLNNKSKKKDLSFKLVFNLLDDFTWKITLPFMHLIFRIVSSFSIIYSYSNNYENGKLVSFELKDEDENIYIEYKISADRKDVYLSIDMYTILFNIQTSVANYKNEYEAKSSIKLTSQFYKYIPEDLKGINHSILNIELIKNYWPECSDEVIRKLNKKILNKLSKLRISIGAIEDEYAEVYWDHLSIIRTFFGSNELFNFYWVTEYNNGQIISTRVKDLFTLPEEMSEDLLYTIKVIGEIELKKIINQDFFNIYNKVISKYIISSLEGIVDSFQFTGLLKGQIPQRLYFDNESDIKMPVSLYSQYNNYNINRINAFIKKWIGKDFFNVADDFQLVRYPELNATSVLFQRKGKTVNLADMGFGISQLFPILLRLPMCDEIGLPILITHPYLLIEEPESNLHPNSQSKLADFFSDIISHFETDLVIETHSEYLIRKFQYLVASKAFNCEDIVIYYFHDPDNVQKGEKQIKEIKILKDGSLSDDFGPGFFDEAINWQFELLKLKNNQHN